MLQDKRSHHSGMHPSSGQPRFVLRVGLRARVMTAAILDFSLHSKLSWALKRVNATTYPESTLVTIYSQISYKYVGRVMLLKLPTE